MWPTRLKNNQIPVQIIRCVILNRIKKVTRGSGTIESRQNGMRYRPKMKTETKYLPLLHPKRLQDSLQNIFWQLFIIWAYETKLKMMSADFVMTYGNGNLMTFRLKDRKVLKVISSLYIFWTVRFTPKTVLIFFVWNSTSFKVCSDHFSRRCNWKWGIGKRRWSNLFCLVSWYPIIRKSLNTFLVATLFPLISSCVRRSSVQK